MSEAELALEQAKLQNLFGIAQSIYDSIAACYVDKSRRGAFLAKAASLDAVYEKFTATLEAVQAMKLAAEPTYVPSFQQLSSFMDLYGEIKYHEKKFDSSSKKDSPESEVKVAQPKLPPLELPSFNGNITDWPTFFETFKSLIHNNKTLSDDQKVQYLVSKLKDQALAVCAGIPPVGSNYEAIWQSLVDRYQDVRYLAGHYVDSILDFQAITTESKVSYNQFIDKFGASVVALQGLDIDDLAEYILYSIAIRKLDLGLSKKYETKVLTEDSMPKFSELLQFVKDYVRVIERTERTHTANVNVPPSPKHAQIKKWPSKPVSFVTSPSHKKENSCSVCKSGSHLLYQCNDFVNMNSFDRLDLIKSLKLCFNCFSPGHSVFMCTNKNVCKICKRKHNTLLHLDTYDKPSTDPPPSPQAYVKYEDKQEDPHSSQSVVTATAVSKQVPSKKYTVLLSTVKVNIPDINGHLHTVRMLLDSGSMSHFITKRCCHNLGIPFQKISATVRGIGSNQSEITGVTAFTFQSRYDSRKLFTVDQAFVVDKITNNLPICPVDAECLSSYLELSLSDDEFHIPGVIDGLIGAELFSLIYGKPKECHDKDGPRIIESELGDIVMGKLPVLSNPGNEDRLCAFVEFPPLESIVQRFWTLEEVPTPKSLCAEDKECEEIFCDTFKRRDDGRYSVSLPFKSDLTLLGDSYKIAEKRFLNLERKLASNPEVKEQYRSAITAYMKDEHAVLSDYDPNATQFFMPHHAVYRPDKTTTKVRVVFDLSCATNNGISLNSLLHTGPTLYNDKFELLLKFRMFPVACTADIQKMFLQISIHEEDRKLQKFLRRDSPQEEIRCNKMQRVVFDMKSSPLLESVPEEDKLLSKVEWDNHSSVKVLGTQYNPTEDKFFFSVNVEDSKCTKRNILSTAARNFDVLRSVSPVSISRLKLCIALLLSTLILFILNAFKTKYDVKHVLCFSEMAVVLSWIPFHPSRWETFIANLLYVLILLNSRPPGHISSDCGDPMLLIPANFLLHQPHASLTHNLDFHSASLGVHYKPITQMIHSFWIMFIMFLVPVSCWPMGRVIQVFPGRDGVSRVALDRTKSGTYKRPAVKFMSFATPVIQDVMRRSSHGGEYDCAALTSRLSTTCQLVMGPKSVAKN
ncbi:hypothetical protein M8J77_017205 [Diaphorina citri]|nr:hypothetical protein M8J77_017205 [Diaphorina citri]